MQQEALQTCFCKKVDEYFVDKHLQMKETCNNYFEPKQPKTTLLQAKKKRGGKAAKRKQMGIINYINTIL